MRVRCGQVGRCATPGVVGAVVPRWPTLASLAAASVEEVQEMWSGLGYYSRCWD